MNKQENDDERLARKWLACQGYTDIQRPSDDPPDYVVDGMYAPALASIKAREIQNWAQNMRARQELPALLRRLIHSTGRDLTRVDFPAYDNAERRGWDGVIETSTPTPWIPDGKSGWEVSCRKDIWRKAESDYAKCMKVPPTERNATTFVFVTARNWKKKQDWAKEKADLDQWKAVRAYDASDLEQWLEQSAPAQIWFAERLGRKVSGYRSIEKCWSEWAEVCEPPLSPTLFNPSVKQFAKTFGDWLAEEPNRPFIVAADSREEALAFLHCLSRSCKTDIPGFDDRMVVFDTPAALRRFDARTRVSLVAVIHDPEVEKVIGDFLTRCHCVIIRPRNSVYGDPDIALDRLGHLVFQKALEDMKLAQDAIERLARESARSPTILRRRLSKIPEVCTPVWAGNDEIARKLLPATMVGAWHTATPGDRAVLRCLARTADDAIVDDHVALLVALEDAPLWSAGEYRGVVSRIDALFGIALFITETDLNNFFQVAEYVLSEKDPSIDLPPGQRWQAGFPEKVRNHSDVLRRGIRETLVILAVHGNPLFRQRLGFDAEARVAELVSKLLRPLDREKILSCSADLPDFAEAAPEIVLSLLEDDLQKPEPVIREFMRPAGYSVFSPPLRTPLLWALEVLAWNPQRFARVVNLLAKLCEMHKDEAHDNWSPKSEETLGSLFRFWLPQTAASLDERVKALKGLCCRHPMLGWSVCIDQLDWQGSVAMPNHRPRWRDDTAGAGHGVTQVEHNGFIRKARDLVLTWPQYDEKKLADLVERLEQFDQKEQLKIWNLIGRWADGSPPEDAKASLRQRIHGCASARHHLGRSIAHPEQERAASKKLLPKDKATRQLFASHWVELPSDGSEDEAFDYERNEQRVRELRMEALLEIWEERGFEGVSILIEKSEETASLIGELMTGILAGRGEASEFVELCLHAADVDNQSAYQSCLTGFLWNADADLVAALIDETERSGASDALITLLLCMPFRATTWRRIDNKPSDFQDVYWKRVEPRMWRDSSGEEINESARRLLTVGRANAAFRAARVAWDQVETSLLKRLLHALPAADSDELLNDPRTGDYNISTAFDELDKRPGVTIEEKARLEYAYLSWLDRSKHGIPNIQKHIAASPEFYVLAIACVCKRADGAEDPPELKFGEPERQLETARQARRRLLYRISYIPGTDDNGNINARELKAWLGEVRSWCARHDRTKTGDEMIGRFLACAPAADGGVWPCRPVCEALEWMASEEVGHGFIVGALNRRGVYSRGEGGDQERDLAARYRGWAQELVEYPYVCGLLERIKAIYDREAEREDVESEVIQRLSLL